MDSVDLYDFLVFCKTSDYLDCVSRHMNLVAD
jgi:hypothetical protein